MDAARGVMEDLDAIADQQIADRAADVANATDNHQNTAEQLGN